MSREVFLARERIRENRLLEASGDGSVWYGAKLNNVVGRNDAGHGT